MAKDKISKAEANYREGSPQKHCGICEMFRAPNGCTDVVGTINRDDVCKLFYRMIGMDDQLRKQAKKTKQGVQDELAKRAKKAQQGLHPDFMRKAKRLMKKGAISPKAMDKMSGGMRGPKMTTAKPRGGTGRGMAGM